MIKLVDLKSKPNKHAVEALEEVLELAKAGELTDYALVFYKQGGVVGSTFNTNHNVMSLLGELRCLERDILDCCVDKRLHAAGHEY